MYSNRQYFSLSQQTTVPFWIDDWINNLDSFYELPNDRKIEHIFKCEQKCLLEARSIIQTKIKRFLICTEIIPRIPDNLRDQIFPSIPVHLLRLVSAWEKIHLNNFRKHSGLTTQGPQTIPAQNYSVTITLIEETRLKDLMTKISKVFQVTSALEQQFINAQRSLAEASILKFQTIPILLKNIKQIEESFLSSLNDPEDSEIIPDGICYEEEGCTPCMSDTEKE